MIWVVLGLFAFAVVYVALRDAAHAVAPHLLFIGTVVPTAAVVLFVLLLAIVRGANHHTRVSWPRALPPAPAGRKLPAPVRGVVLGGPQAPAGAFSVELAEEPEEKHCEAPECPELLGEMTWTVEAVTETDGLAPVTETHSFCSRDCAERYARQAEGAQV
jgi:hypothetical protein